MNFPSSIISFNMTMTDDNAHRITEFDIPYYEVNLHCYTNDLNYGTGEVIAAKIIADDVASFRNGNLKDFLFKNATAGQNGQIVAVAVVPTKFVKQSLAIKGGF